MKKLVIIALVVLVVIGASVMWILRGMGVSDAALLLPSETVALVSLPDLPRSFIRWKDTTLAKIGAEDQLKAFLEKPLQYLTEKRGGDEASGIVWQLKPGRIFAASVDVSENDAALLVGFQYWGGKTAHDAAVARLREELTSGGPAVVITSETYQGTEILSSVHGKATIYNASHGQWGFISNNLPALQEVLDRAAGRRMEGHLADSATYKKVLTHLDPEPDLLIFVQPQSLLDTLVTVGTAFGAQPAPDQIAQAKQVQAVGFTSRFDGPNIKDSLFVLRPTPPDMGSLTHQGIKLTTPQTTAFFDFVVNFNQLAQAAKDPALSQRLAGTPLENSPLLTLIPEAFGPECVVSLDWPEGQFKPEGVLAITVKDQAKAEQSIQEMLTLFPETTVTDLAGVKYYSFPSLQNDFATPSMAMADGFVLLGLDPAEIDRVRQAFQSGQSLADAPAFAPIKASYESSNEVFGYIDAKTIFERGFPYVRQIATFGAAMMPGVSDMMDSSKIPETETIAKHLQPITYSQTRLDDGYLVQSSGPITMNHAILLGAGTGASFFKK